MPRTQMKTKAEPYCQECGKDLQDGEQETCNTCIHFQTNRMRVNIAVASHIGEGGEAGYFALVHSHLRDEYTEGEASEELDPMRSAFAISGQYPTGHEQHILGDMAHHCMSITQVPNPVLGGVSNPSCKGMTFRFTVQTPDHATAQEFEKAAVIYGIRDSVEITVPGSDHPLIQQAARLAQRMSREGARTGVQMSPHSHFQLHRRGLHYKAPAQDPLDPQDLWRKEWNPELGKFLVEGHDHDLWDSQDVSDIERQWTGEDTDTERTERLLSATLTRGEARQELDNIFARRTATKAVRDAIAGWHHLPEEVAVKRADEVLDRTYNFQLMLQAGVAPRTDDAQRHYQYFYEQGMHPAGHASMAEHLIATSEQTRAKQGCDYCCLETEQPSGRYPLLAPLPEPGTELCERCNAQFAKQDTEPLLRY